MRVAVVRNNRQSGVLARFGDASLEAGMDDAAGLVVDALRGEGHTAITCEGDSHLPESLRRFMPPTGDGEPGGFVFNLATGLQGECARGHVPAMLELCGVPYTGPGPVCHALTWDTANTRVLLGRAGVPVTPFAVLRSPGSEAPDLRFPLVVRPRREQPGFGPSIARSPSQLAEAVERIAEACQQESLVEELRDNAVFTVALLHNGPTVEALPFFVESPDTPRLLDASLYARIRRPVAATAAAAFDACGCRDFAVVRLSFDGQGNALVASVDPSPRLTPRSVFVRAAVAGGYTHAALTAAILDAAHTRYFGTVAPRFDVPHHRIPRDHSYLFPIDDA